jgi:hypothetical protein
MQITDIQLKKYLLGALDAGEAERIDLAVISDEAFEERLLIAENDLIEDFLEEMLAPDEEKLFYENFLVSGRRRKDVEEIALVKKFAKSRTGAKTAPQKKSSSGLIGKIKDLFKFRLRYAAPALAAVVIVVLIGVYFYQRPAPLTSLEQEYAAINKSGLTEPRDHASLTNVNLIPGVFRDSSGAARKISFDGSTERIFFRLALDGAGSEIGSVSAELYKDEKLIFRQPEVGIYDNRSGREIRLLVPKKVLSKGAYRIEIKIPGREAPPLIFDFAVE